MKEKAIDKIEKALEKEQMDKEQKKEQKITDIYDALQKKHKLPAYDVLNKSFDIDTIDPDSKHPIKEIAKKIFERTDSFRKILEGIQQSDTSIVSMIEAEFLTEQEHETINSSIRELMRLDRLLLYAELTNTENDYATFIIDTQKEWSVLKEQLAPIIQKLSAQWKKPSATKTPHHYVG